MLLADPQNNRTIGYDDFAASREGLETLRTADYHPSDEDLSLGTPGQETGATPRPALVWLMDHEKCSLMSLR